MIIIFSETAEGEEAIDLVSGERVSGEDFLKSQKLFPCEVIGCHELKKFSITFILDMDPPSKHF